MRQRTNVFTIGLAGLLTAQACLGWGEVGHRTVGRVAAALLTPAAQKKVAAILGVGNSPAEVANAMSDAAEWPDKFARTDYPVSVPWHFIDLGVKANPVKDNPLWASPDTAFARIVKYYATFKQGAPDELEPGSDLKFLVHLIGDVHQPLHTATDQDRGGNCLFVKVTNSQGALSGKDKYHHAWDDSILEDRIGKDDRVIALHLVRDWNKLSKNDQIAMIGPAFTGNQATIRSWIQESHDEAVAKLYGTLKNPAPPQLESVEVASNCSNAAPVLKSTVWSLDEASAENAARIIEEQLTKAGVRLAAVVNDAAK